jgi:hypothetical protein
MSYVIAAPEMMTKAATDVATIGSTLDVAHREAAAATVGMAPAAADEVSAAIASVFSRHAQAHQALASQASAFNGQFVQNLATGAAAYTGSEDVIVSLLRGLEVGVRDFGIGYDQQVIKFISGSDSWIGLVPGPLRAFAVGIPFLSIFTSALPLVAVELILQATINAITG